MSATDSRSLVRFFTYACVGVAGTAAQYVFLFAAVSVGWLTPVPATVIGAILGAIVNYALNARFTFRSKDHASAMPKFAATAVVGIAINGGLMKALTQLTPWNYMICQVIVTLVVLLVTYAINLLWTFRRVENLG